MLIGGAYVKCGLGACPAFRPDWMSRIVNYGKYSSNCLARWSRQIEDPGLREHSNWRRTWVLRRPCCRQVCRMLTRMLCVLAPAGVRLPPTLLAGDHHGPNGLFCPPVGRIQTGAMQKAAQRILLPPQMVGQTLVLRTTIAHPSNTK